MKKYIFNPLRQYVPLAGTLFLNNISLQLKGSYQRLNVIFKSGDTDLFEKKFNFKIKLNMAQKFELYFRFFEIFRKSRVKSKYL